MSVLGFGFWWLCARLFTPDQIGYGTALISGMTLISYFSLLGVNSAFIRFLPKSIERNEELNTGLLLVAGTAVVISAAYVGLLPWLAPRLDFVRTNAWFALGFVVLAAMAAINLLTDSVFIAYRASQYNLLINSIMSLAKLMLPVAVIGLGAYGIFFASGVAAVLALGLSVYYMVRRFSYRPEWRIHRAVVGRVFSFASANYVANCLNIAPTMALPLVVVNRLGAAEAGYFYLAFMVANLLYTTAYSVAQSLFAEGSHSEEELAVLVRRAVTILALIMVPASALLALCSPWLLLVFGKTYSLEASTTLAVLALAAPALAVYTVAVVLLRVRKQIYSIIAMNVVFATVIIGLALAWTGRGLVWAAWAWLVGHIVAGGCGMAMAAWGPRLRRGNRKR
ncbi:MAG TPA: oligosaccharide flippase family protein [Candidatus Saccharimonadia bacterium]|nr:oligosaccharide flippase family protein [Candidatus Saccharimonadia bacterium]